MNTLISRLVVSGEALSVQLLLSKNRDNWKLQMWLQILGMAFTSVAYTRCKLVKKMWLINYLK